MHVLVRHGISHRCGLCPASYAFGCRSLSSNSLDQRRIQRYATRDHVVRMHLGNMRISAVKYDKCILR